MTKLPSDVQPVRSGRPTGRDVLRSLSLESYIEFVITTPGLLDLLDTLPGKEPGTPGRPQSLPPAVLGLAFLVISEAGNMSKGQQALDGLWQFFQEELGGRYPKCEALQPRTKLEKKRHRRKRRRDPLVRPEGAPSRQTIGYWRDRYLCGRNEEAVRNILHELNTRAAADLGILQGSGSLTEPLRCDALYGDGVVFPARSKIPLGSRGLTPDGELVERRSDADSLLHHQGDNTKATGLKAVIFGASNGYPNEKLILDVATTGHNEARTAVDVAKSLLPRFDQTHALTYDKALEGTHVIELHRAGLPVVVPVKNKDGEPLEYPLGNLRFKSVLGKEVDAPCIAIAGVPHLITATVDGEPVHVRLTPGQIQRRKNKDGSHRVYRHFTVPSDGQEDAAAVPSRLRGAGIRIPFTLTSADLRSGFNRGQYLRLFGTDEDAYKRVHSIRNTAESHNSWLKDHMQPQRLAPVYGSKRLRIHLLFMAMHKNLRASIANRARLAAP